VFSLKFIADFHIHSHYSIATSKKLIPEYLEYWARLKGINIIGTGDCIHPGWQKELAQKLEPADNGMFRLKEEYKLEESKKLKHEFIPDEIYFILTGELSSIYKRDGKVRKVHNICIFPDMESLLYVQKKLSDIGNITSDGRPILGLDSRELLAMMLESSPLSFVIPAHIWTPWFSVLGSKSGFDSIEECYGDLTKEIFAVETGLSSDPEMNWHCSFLDAFRLVSNSDAHSPEKLGREANLFDTELSYEAIYNALKYDRGFVGTIEFYPEEGKYHLDGHRNCGIVWDPMETAMHKGICPVCGKEVTKGVMYRVAELSDRDNVPDALKKDFYSITQLPDLLTEIMQKGNFSKILMNEYFRLIKNLGSEFHIFMDSNLADIKAIGGELLAEGIRRLRNGEVYLEGGYDGEFGVVKVFEEGEINSFASSSSLFSLDFKEKNLPKKNHANFDVALFKKMISENSSLNNSSLNIEEKLNEEKINIEERFSKKDFKLIYTDEQRLAIEHCGPSVVIAGPGTGKTFLITEKVKELIIKGSDPSQIAVLTFSNRAANELRERIGRDLFYDKIQISTMHSLGYKIIKDNAANFGIGENFLIITDRERAALIKEIFNLTQSRAEALLKNISAYKQGIDVDLDEEIFRLYNKSLIDRNFIDIDDLIYLPVLYFAINDQFSIYIKSLYRHLLVDEFQDINYMQYRFIMNFVNHKDFDICVIGDPDQSIYAFRGAGAEFFRHFKISFPFAKEFILQKSFRCSSIILKAAGQVLQKDEFLASDRKGVKIVVNESQSERSEADWIATEIERLVGGVRSFSIDSGISDGSGESMGFGDFAVLCRSTFMFESIIEAFKNHGIAYKIAGNKPFYEYEPYIFAVQQIRDAILGLSKDSVLKLKPLIENMTVYDLFIHLLNEYGAPFDLQRISLFFDGIKTYEDFMVKVTLSNAHDDYVPDFEAVSLLTIHASKGLEFDTVFIPGCEEGIVPFNLFGSKNFDIEEERRIFYVGLTRAKRNLYLSYSKKRNFKGRNLELKKSSFIDLIEKDIINNQKRESKIKKDDIQLDLF